MCENRLATYNDYSPDRAGVRALKTKFLEYLMQANAMANLFPDMVPVQDPAGPAGDLLHQYNANYMVPQTDAERRAVEEESMKELALDQVREFEENERRALPQNEKDKLKAALRISAEAHRALVLKEERQIQEALRISANEIKTATNLGNANDRTTLLDVIPLFEYESTGVGFCWWFFPVGRVVDILVCLCVLCILYQTRCARTPPPKFTQKILRVVYA